MQIDGAAIRNSESPGGMTEVSANRIRTAAVGKSKGRSDSITHSDATSSVSDANFKLPARKITNANKSKVDKSKTPRLSGPISRITDHMKDVPVRDIPSLVNRSTEERLEEVARRGGAVPRPMNAFMLYRSMYADRVKAWCLQNNHQVISSICGESWALESEDVRNQFDEWSKIERTNHQRAHPHYKFSPSKANGKRQRSSTEDGQGDEVAGEFNDEYARSAKHLRLWTPHVDMLPGPRELEQPYYGQQYRDPQYHNSRLSQFLPESSVDSSSRAYTVPTHAYTYPGQYGQFGQDAPAPRNQTSINMSAASSMGRLGLPGGHLASSESFPSPAGSLQYCGHFSPTEYNVYSVHDQFQPYHYNPDGGLHGGQESVQQVCTSESATDTTISSAPGSLGLFGSPQNDLQNLGPMSIPDIASWYSRIASPSCAHPEAPMAPVVPIWSMHQSEG